MYTCLELDHRRYATTTIFLCGDVMTGRGIDQILPHPGDPALRERVVNDARTYVTLAERVNGAIGRSVPYAWPWGEALAVLDEYAPDVRLINLETAVTERGTPEPKTLRSSPLPSRELGVTCFSPINSVVLVPSVIVLIDV